MRTDNFVQQATIMGTACLPALAMFMMNAPFAAAVFCLAPIMLVLAIAIQNFAISENAEKASRFAWMKELRGLIGQMSYLRPGVACAHSYEDRDKCGITVEFKLDKDHYYSADHSHVDFDIRFTNPGIAASSIMSGKIALDDGGHLVIASYDRVIGWRAIDTGAFLVDALRQEIASNAQDGDMRCAQIDNLLPRASSAIEGSRANLTRLLASLSANCMAASRRFADEPSSILATLSRHAANVNSLIGDNGDPGARVSGLLDYILPRADQLVSKLEYPGPSREVSATLETLAASFSRIEMLLREEKDSVARSEALLIGLASSEILSMTRQPMNSIV